MARNYTRWTWHGYTAVDMVIAAITVVLVVGSVLGFYVALYEAVSYLFSK